MPRPVGARSAPSSRASDWSSPPAGSRSAAMTPTTCSVRTRRSPTSPGSAATRSRTRCWSSNRCAGGGHDAVLYFKPWAGRESDEFFGDARYGEFWVGRRPTLEDIEAEFGLTAPPHRRVRRRRGQGRRREVGIRVVRDADRDADRARSTRPAASVGARPRGQRRSQAQARPTSELARFLSTLRLVKDEWEVEQMRRGGRGHRSEGSTPSSPTCPRPSRTGRGERWVEGVFGLLRPAPGQRRRLRLHLRRRRPRQHAALDQEHRRRERRRPAAARRRRRGRLAVHRRHHPHPAGQRRRSPTPSARSTTRCYAAQEAGLAAVRPGNKFSDVHEAAIRVIAEHLHEWGLLPEGVDVEDTLDTEHGQYHRRWMVHGTSHHLGIDVHDCAQALREEYMDAVLTPAWSSPSSPACTSRPTTSSCPRSCAASACGSRTTCWSPRTAARTSRPAMPRTSTDVEAWIARLWNRVVPPEG